MKRALALAVGAVAGVVVLAAPAAAHPLGNFTTNVAAAVDVGSDRVALRYVVDLAEIPALRLSQTADTTSPRWAAEECGRLANGLSVSVAAPVRLSVDAASATQPPGEAGLSTLRLECELSGPYEPGGRQVVTFRDGNFVDRIGWREVTVVATGAELLQSAAPSTSPSDVLRDYPSGPVLDERSATATIRPGEGSAPVVSGTSEAGSGDGLTRAFTSLVSERDLTLPFGALAVVLALLLGAVHALAPGHGKTVMAAYLVGREGDRRLAVLLGLTVASTHTMAVLVLGTVVSASETVAPERAYPWLGALSGVLFASVGAGLLLRALRSRRRRRLALASAVAALEHVHVHDDVLVGVGAGGHHHHHDHDHDHDHGHTHAFPEPERLGWRSVVAPGLAGGLVPSPSALLVYLAGLALGRAWFGVALVVTYGFGIAASLVGAGYALVRARDRLVRTGRLRAIDRIERVSVALPLVTAVAVTGGGLWIAVRALGELGG